MMSSLSTSIKPSATLYERPGCPDHEHLRRPTAQDTLVVLHGAEITSLGWRMPSRVCGLPSQCVPRSLESQSHGEGRSCLLSQNDVAAALMHGPAVVQFPHERRLDRADPAGENLGHNCTFDAGLSHSRGPCRRHHANSIFRRGSSRWCGCRPSDPQLAT